MRRTTRLDFSPSGRTFAARLAFAAAIAASAFAACTDPRSEVIAQFPDSAGNADTGVGTAGATGEAGAGGTSGGGAVITPMRGRVQVVNGNLVTDVGTPLRGLLLPVDTTWALSAFDLDVIKTYAQSTGLNTLHVYLEDSGQVTGSNETVADALVSLAAQNGMYVIIGVGTGVNVGTFDQNKLTEFWNLYAGRYADQTHVLFEIQNNPDKSCSTAISASTLAMEHKVYNQIRGFAPDSHVLLLSTEGLLTPSVLQAAITDLSTDVNWSNASIDMDANKTPCQPLANLSDLTAVAKARGVPLLIGQLPQTDWGPYITAFEAAQLGWMQYTYFADPPRTLAAYLTGTKAAAVTWCPDQGTFPQDSSTCH
jgi:Cellulase (glycosyl hydrolase family 5)